MQTTKNNDNDRRVAYDHFIEQLVLAFDKDFDLIAKVADTAYGYLDHIPAYAYKGMEHIAVRSWARWPPNFPKAVSEVYEQWRHETKHTAHTAMLVESSDCEYCNNAGVFSVIKHVDVKPGVRMEYRYTFRCAACRHWLGIYGDKIPAAWPLEMKTRGYEVELYPQPFMLEEERQQSSLPPPEDDEIPF